MYKNIIAADPLSGDWDNAPPLLHTADKDRLPLDTASSDSDEEDVTVESIILDDVMEEWEEVEDIIRVPSLGVWIGIQGV